MTGNIPYRKSSTNRESGFTLLELIVVCMIIGILATMSISLLSRAKIGARESAAVVTLNSFAGAYEAYWSRNGEYPHWGPGMRFSNPKELMSTLVLEGYLPRAYSTVPYVQSDRLFFWITDDYAVEIYPFNDADGKRDPSSYYWILFHPIGFQRERGYLGIGTTPLTGKGTVRPRASKHPGDIDTFTIYSLHRR